MSVESPRIQTRPVRKLDTNRENRAIIAGDAATPLQIALEKIERQLFHLIDQVRVLKKT